MGFSRQEYWSGLPFPPPGDLPDPGIEPRSPALQADSLPPELQGKPPRLPQFGVQVCALGKMLYCRPLTQGNLSNRQGSLYTVTCLFNLYAEYIMRNAGLEETQAGIKIPGRNINNLRYADDTTLMAESEEN